ncbi:MAG: ABC transporter permease [Clostridiales bacterium]|jgi:ABC-type dipeptide/oligopeptide/nickel transport system permease subunit|nr:ABC transporter permease [Clostridiales bacterium]
MTMKMDKEKKPSSLWKDALKRFMRNKTAVVSFCVLVVLALMAAFAPFVAPYDPYETDMKSVKATPSAEHWLGCDENGRDILSRLIYGARISLTVGFLSVAISVTIGAFIGMVSAFYGGAVDAVLSRLMEIISSFPSVLLAIIFMSVFGRGIENAIIAVALVGIPGPARIVRSATLSVQENDYITAARAIGCSNLTIILRHILPNIMAPIIVNATMSVSGAILSTAALGFLGLGVQPPTAEWGYMLSNGKNFVFTAPHLILFPGMAIAITVLSFNLLGDGLRDALDPRLK